MKTLTLLSVLLGISPATAMQVTDCQRGSVVPHDNVVLLDTVLASVEDRRELDQKFIAELEKLLVRKLAEGNFGTDPQAGELLAPIEGSYLEALAPMLRRLPQSPLLTPAAAETLEPGQKYSFVVLPRQGGGTEIRYSACRHIHTGRLEKVVVAGDIEFRRAELSRGPTLMVVDALNLQSGLYEPHAARAGDALHALIEAGFDSQRLWSARIETGIPIGNGAKGNTLIVNFANYAPFLTGN